MKTTLLAATASIATLCILSYATEARALGPIDLEVAAKGGYASNPGSGSNPLGVGIGARAGVSFIGIYGGVNVVYYLGENSVHALQYGLEAGYGFKLGPLTLRPQLGLGNLSISLPDPFPGTSSVYLEPGAVALISLGMLFLGADVNALIATSSGYNPAFSAHGQVGLKF